MQPGEENPFCMDINHSFWLFVLTGLSKRTHNQLCTIEKNYCLFVVCCFWFLSPWTPVGCKHGVCRFGALLQEFDHLNCNERVCLCAWRSQMFWNCFLLMCACVELCWNQNWIKKKKKREKKKEKCLEKKKKSIKKLLPVFHLPNVHFCKANIFLAKLQKIKKKKFEKSCKVIVYESWWIKKKS